MFKKILSIGLLALTIGFIPAVTPVQAETNKSVETITTVETETMARRFGPYATIRRANEVANIARRYGYKARVIYGGGLYTRQGRVYYVDVWI